jgi:hypothetical protein
VGTGGQAARQPDVTKAEHQYKISTDELLTALRIAPGTGVGLEIEDARLVVTVWREDKAR